VEPAGPAEHLGKDLQQAPGVLRAGEPVDGQRSGGLGRDAVRHQPVGLLTQEDLPGAGGLLEALGEVDGVAGEVLLDRAGVAHQQPAGVDADPELELDTALATQLLGQLADGGAEVVDRPDRAQGVVLVQFEHAEGGHEAVAVALADAGAAAAEDPADGFAVAVVEAFGDQRLEPPAEDRRVDHVAEQHGDDAELSRRDGSAERRAAARARLARPVDDLIASRACRHVKEYMGRVDRRTVGLRTVGPGGEPCRPGLRRWKPGTRSAAGWLGYAPHRITLRGDGVAPQRRRSASDFEQALRRQELAAGRGLMQALPSDETPGPRELAAARRVLTQAVFDLRRLGRDLDHEIEQLRARQRAGERQGRARGAGGPGELDRYEAARNAIDEVIERWERRREQLSAELDRRQPGRGAGRRAAGGVSGRAGAPARPGPPRSRRSRRSPG
jgi:hypothetical protein